MSQTTICVILFISFFFRIGSSQNDESTQPYLKVTSYYIVVDQANTQTYGEYAEKYFGDISLWRWWLNRQDTTFLIDTVSDENIIVPPNSQLRIPNMLDEFCDLTDAICQNEKRTFIVNSYELTNERNLLNFRYWFGQFINSETNFTVFPDVNPNATQPYIIFPWSAIRFNSSDGAYATIEKFGFSEAM